MVCVSIEVDVKFLIKLAIYIHNKNFSFNDYPKTGFPANTYYYCTNKENQVDDTNVIDDEMKDYLQMVLDEVKSQSEKDRTNNL